MGRKPTCARCDALRQPRHPYCKPCRAAYMRDYRSKHFKSKENAKKDRARAYTTSLLKRGKIERGPCNDCGATKTQAHHPDYDNPRVVEWLCETCHRARHKAERSKNAQSIHSFLYGK